MASVGSTPMTLMKGPLLIQNLGPDVVYVGHSTVLDIPEVSDEEGFQVSPGRTISIGPTNTKISVVSAGDSDVRTLASGTGVYSTPIETTSPETPEEPA